MDASISNIEFARFQQFIYQAAGIQLSDAKKSLVSSRLAGRLRQRAVASFGEYFQLISSASEAAETQIAIDLLTTNETYFFRERKHFDLLRRVTAERLSSPREFRVWSAASSSGEEAYSIAMVLAQQLGERPWEVFASDLSTRVLARARAGHYPMERATQIPRDFLQRFCLKGTGPQQGTLLVAPELRARVRFEQVNLTRPLPDVGQFDVIFLRNVMIYFDVKTKRTVVDALRSKLRPGGYFLIGHSETLHGIDDRFTALAPATYQKPV